jgi:hypothetical protein
MQSSLANVKIFSARLLEGVAMQDGPPDMLTRLLCSLAEPEAARSLLTLLLSPAMLVEMGPVLTRWLERLLPNLQLADLYRLLAGLQPARPDLAPRYLRLIPAASVDQDVEEEEAPESRAATGRCPSTVGLLHLFVSSLIEVIKRRASDSESPVATSFQKALLAVSESLSGVGCDKGQEGRDVIKCESVDGESVREVLLACGFAHVLVKRSRGAPLAWGANTVGCTGLPPTNAASHSPGPLSALRGLRVVQVACGRSHSLALTDCGVYSWGSNRYGQLGTGGGHQAQLARTFTPTWIAVGGKSTTDTVVKISAGQYHSLAVDVVGRLYSWGWAVHGQLGHHHSSVDNVDRPTVVGYLRHRRIVDTAGGFAHSLALSAEGEVYAFGLGLFGQMGSGATAKATRPYQVVLPGPVRLIATGYFHCLALIEPADVAGGVSLGQQQMLFQWGAHPQVLRLEAQQRRRQRQQLQKAAVEENSAASSTMSVAKGSPFIANGGVSSYCINETHPVLNTCGHEDSLLAASDVDPELGAATANADLAAASPALEGSLQAESMRAYEEPVSEQHLLPQASRSEVLIQYFNFFFTFTFSVFRLSPYMLTVHIDISRLHRVELFRRVNFQVDNTCSMVPAVFRIRLDP